jgi:SAM-dependent methyltransferase
MRSPRVMRALLLGFVITSGALAGAQPATETKPYEPEVGQQGKDVVWVPTADALVEKMLDLAHVTSSDYLIDLGSGDGRTVIAAAKRGARALGVEYNPDMVALSKRNAEKAGVSRRASFVQADLFKVDLSRATVITMFLLPEINMKLRPTLLNLKPGTRIVSNSFSMEDWEADKREVIEGENAGCSSWCTALFWIVPAKVEGVWRLPEGELALTQKFQMVSGTLGKVPISQGRLRGAEISFSVGTARYTGSVRANSMFGTVTGSASNRTWAATRTEPQRALKQGSTEPTRPN